ncbi:MAG: anti-sigma factor family protein [Planctomycetota bacterium]|jgi:hypothetical protein
MSHLTEEQFEDIIQGTLPEPEHLADCDRCKELLAEKTAIANRLRSAFASVKPNDRLAKNIRMQLTNKAEPEKPQFQKRQRNVRFRRIAWPAAAAAVLIVAVIFGVYDGINPQYAMAAKAELVKIHNHNLTEEHEFYSETDPEKLAEYFKSKLGFSPSMPVPGKGMALRGCCVRHFRGKVVGSYVVGTPQGVMSVIVVTDKPRSLGMSVKFEHEGRRYGDCPAGGLFVLCRR